jgi:hypothetical protein
LETTTSIVPLHAVGLGVDPRQLQRVGRDVQRANPEAGAFDGQRHRDAPAARSEVHDPRSVGEVQRQHRVDDALGLRPRDHRPPVHAEVEPVELLRTGDVLGRLAGRATVDPARVSPRQVVGQLLLPANQQTATVGVEQSRQQELGLEPRGRHPRGLEPFRGLGQPLPDRAQGPTSCLSFSVWSWAARDSMISSIAPFMIAGRLCKVRPTR